ncbi:uncharacterized mitochondrial protein AtMg00810-like [Hibiscus syriacus]|uniref:uncharacterized mitochondrial protein AtMg00810-like n=1 Tax=Hibiscus syriacus TaxID=106335 RepID=UPI00192286AA|nr:uncharacterized mitochondrial protein AtMg00810-like [Hibiscus syriacus]
MLVYVDGIIITGESTEEVEKVVQQLSDKFLLKDLGELHYFLGIEIKKPDDHSYDRVHQAVTRCKRTSRRQVSEHVGALLYICHTRSDIVFSVDKVAQFMHALRELHILAVKRILHYLGGTLYYGLEFSPAASGPKSISTFADADWGGSVDDRRSISGNYVRIGNNVVSLEFK